MKRRTGFRPVAGLLCLFSSLGWSLSEPARSEELVLRNDSVVDFNQVAIQVGFAADERAAAWLTSTCNGDLTTVQILWLSVTGGTGQTLGESITISEVGSFPNPGAQLAHLVGPVLTDGFFNELPVVPPIPITAGQTVVVDFRFLTATPATGPSVVTDIDGCQLSRNAIFAIPPGLWLDACALGVSGDFAIRAVVDCPTLIFEDGFESGDTSGWTSHMP